jgi:hypothetical protein
VIWEGCKVYNDAEVRLWLPEAVITRANDLRQARRVSDAGILLDEVREVDRILLQGKAMEEANRVLAELRELHCV